MTHEQIKAAVLAECERLCPNPSDVHKFSVNIALQGLAKKNFKKRWQLWIWSKTLVISEDTLNEDYELGTVAFQLFGLNQPPADTKWERLKEKIESSRVCLEKQDKSMGDWNDIDNHIKVFTKLITSVEEEGEPKA